MESLAVVLQAGVVTVRLATSVDLAHEPELGARLVNLHVLLHVGRVREGFPTHNTRKGTFTGVQPHVPLQVGFPAVRSVAHRANVRCALRRRILLLLFRRRCSFEIMLRTGGVRQSQGRHLVSGADWLDAL